MNNRIINHDAEKAAQAVIASIGKSRPTIEDLARWVEENFKKKIQIKFLDFGNKVCSGLVCPGKDVYRIWIAKNEPFERQHFTLGHELGHIIGDMNLNYGFLQEDIYTAKGMERFCNRFSAAFLMPKQEFIRKWSNNSEPYLLKRFRIGKDFEVSKEAVYYRAKELGLILD